jgi:hypothetical protein
MMQDLLARGHDAVVASLFSSGKPDIRDLGAITGKPELALVLARGMQLRKG